MGQHLSNERQIYINSLHTLLHKREVIQSESTFSKTRRIGTTIVLHAIRNIKDKLSTALNRVDKTALTNKNWFVIISANNYSSLQLLKGKLPNSVFILLNRQINNNDTYQIFAYGSIKNLKELFLFVRQLRREYPSNWFTNLDWIVKIWNSYSKVLSILKHHRPTSLTFSNDHHPLIRVFMHAAKELNIPTIYLQHASVSTLFPPLGFDLNLLEGKHAWDTYKKCGKISGQVKLIGMSKYDPHHPTNPPSSYIKRVGICCNALDSLDRIEKLLTSVSNIDNLEYCTYRPHPRDKRDINIKNLRKSNPKSESSFDFISRHDAIIAGDSSILLEATLMGRPTFYHKMNPSVHIDDYYGFVKYGLTKRIDNLDDLKSFLSVEINAKKTRAKAKYYVDTIETEYDGRSTDLALKYILDFLD